MAFEALVQGGGILTQDFGQTPFAEGCRCEWTCPGYAPGSFHAGIDIAPRSGSEPLLLAAGYGRCVRVGRVLPGYWCNGLGPFAPCIRSGGLDFWFGHAKQALVQVGQSVVPGQPIAVMDSIGCSTGNHVHFEVLPAGSDPNGCAALNPWPYIQRWPGAAPAVSPPAPAPAPLPPPAPAGGGLAPLLLLAGGGLLLAARARTPR